MSKKKSPTEHSIQKYFYIEGTPIPYTFKELNDLFYDLKITSNQYRKAMGYSELPNVFADNVTDTIYCGLHDEHESHFWRLAGNHWCPGFKEESDTVKINKRAEILQHAEKLINGDRADIYGPPEQSFGRIADLLNAMGWRFEEEAPNDIHYSKNRPLNSVDVALGLVQLKVSRTIGATDHEDNWVDMAGYAALGAEMALRNKNDKA